MDEEQDAESPDDTAAGNRDRAAPKRGVAQPGEVLGQWPNCNGLAELRSPGLMELDAHRRRCSRDARVIDVVVEDQAPRGRVFDPDTAVSEELRQAEPQEERVEAGLPDAPGVASARHIPRDAEEVPSTDPVAPRPTPLRVELREKGGEPLGDVREEAAPPVLHVWRGAVEVGTADVDGVLDRTDGRGPGRDEAVRDVVSTIGVREDARRRIGLVGVRDAELVEHIWIPRVAARIVLAREDRHDVPNGDADVAILGTVGLDLGDSG
jgi:hypothetical protein